jgi:hypothetical protein
MPDKYAFVRRQTTHNSEQADKILLSLRTPGQPYYTGKYELVDVGDFNATRGSNVEAISVHDTFEEAKMFADMINKQREIEGT